MKVVFKHKNEEFFKEVCKLLPSFAKRFQKACEEQWDDSFDFIDVDRDNYAECFYWDFLIPKKDIERVEIEELKPFVWYPASKWDENPERHALVERMVNGDVYAFRELNLELDSGAEFFMLVPKNENIKPKC